MEEKESRLLISKQYIVYNGLTNIKKTKNWSNQLVFFLVEPVQNHTYCTKIDQNNYENSI